MLPLLRTAIPKYAVLQKAARPLTTVVTTRLWTSQPVVRQQVMQRSFSSTSRQHELLDLVTRELDEELDNDTLAIPADLKELKEKLQKEWKIVDDGALTQMYKTHNNTLKVQVSFHCQDIVEIEGEEEFTDETSAPVRFTATVTRAGQSMVLTCMSEDAAVRIQSVAISSKPVDELQRQGGVGMNEYQGPEFSELAEDLQEAYYAFLEEEVGLDQDLATFVAMHTDYKEQTQYVDFLEKCKGILQ